MNHIDSFLYVRHGQTDWNAKGLLQFHSDIPLNATGQTQAQDAAEKLAKLSGERLFFLYSPYSRAAETAGIIARHLHDNTDVTVAGIAPHTGLKERFGGSLDAMYYDDLIERSEQVLVEGEVLWDHLQKFCPKAECSVELTSRMAEALLYGYEQAEKQNAKLVVVGHFGSMNAIRRHRMGHSEEFVFKNATPYLFVNEFDKQGKWLIEEME